MNISIHIPVYNEEIMLPFTILFYRSRFKNCEIIIYDNKSTDNTVKIAVENNCMVEQFDTEDKINDIKLQKLKNNCWKESNTDWVLICDCDELIDITSEQLQNEDTLGSSIISSEGYDMVNMNDDMNICNINRGIRNRNYYDKKILFNKSKIFEINYGIGAHVCSPSGNIIYSNSIYKLYHYKFINLDYMIKRYSLYKCRMSQENIENGWEFKYLLSEEAIIKLFEEAKLKCKKIINN